MNFEALARPEILAMRPYVSARGGAAADGVLLNANEAPAMLLDEPEWSSMALHRYPAPQPGALRARLADIYGISENRILVTRGSDEGIDLLLRVFCRPGVDAILECPPCFGMYRVAAQIQGAGIIGVPRQPDSLRIDHPALGRAIASEPRPRLVFLTNPNNPTGDRVQDEELLRILEAGGDHSLLVLDEAYIEFCAAGSATRLCEHYPQLVVLRTLSKAWAAAGLRCGAVIAHPAVIGLLRRVMAPYPLSAPAIAAALAATAVGAAARQAALLEHVARNKDRLLSYLERQDWIRQTWPGEANFVLVRADDGPGLVGHCAQHGVRLRDFSDHALLEDCVRITVGSVGDMEALERALDAWRNRP